MDIKDYVDKIEQARQKPVQVTDENPTDQEGKYRVFFRQYELGIYNDTGTDFASALEYDVILYFQDTIKNYGEFRELQDLFDQAFEKFAPEYFPLLTSGQWLQWNSFYVRKIYNNRYTKQVSMSLYPEEELAECLSWHVLEKDKWEWERWTELKNLLLKDCLDFIEPKLQEILKEQIELPPIPSNGHFKVSRTGLEYKLFKKQISAEILGKEILREMGINDENIEIMIEERTPINVGRDLTPQEEKAYWTYNELLADTKWKGKTIDGGTNLKPVVIYQNIGGKKRIVFEELIPIWEGTPAEWCEKWGVPRIKSARGKMEFEPKARKIALRALIDMSEKIRILYYERTKWENGKEIVERIKRRKTFWRIDEVVRKMTDREKNAQIGLHKANITDDKKEYGKTRYIRIEGDPIFFDKLDNYYALFPFGFILHAQNVISIRRKLGKKSPDGTLRFIALLGESVANQRAKKMTPPWTLSWNHEKIAEKIGYEKLIRQGKKKSLRENLNAIYDTCKDIGCVLSYETVDGLRDEKDVIVINPQYFKNDQEIQQGSLNLIEPPITPKEQQPHPKAPIYMQEDAGSKPDEGSKT